MKHLILLLSTLCIIGTAEAQDVPFVPKIKVDLGPKIGINLSKLDGESWDGGYKTNLLGGVFLNVHSNRFGVQVEGLFTQTTYITGSSFDSIYHEYVNAGKDSLEHGSFRISYFNIPLMAQVRILSRVWLQVGAQYSGVVSVRDKDEFLKDAEGLFNSGSISGVGGLWIDVSRRVNVGARYVMGLSNLNDQYDKIPESWKQRDVQIHIGLTF
jgi:hypothetical protein